ncbi:PTS ascorbate transporter subunit IIC [Mycoplasmopsis primatum]|uniref:PTS ascorbate transporter subunit IIC n=1 Tax=Mycoplasmopsis primatum TaxID=55604 RepID=UPI000495B822|nr:PTS ascorbate transporter subunit IIC [Mycoplasmopsis primatum]
MSETQTKNKKPFNWIVLVGVLIAVLVIVAIYIGAVWYKGWDWKNGSLFFIKNILLNNFLGVNSILIGLLVFIGYLVLGRGFSGTIIGTLKAMIGVLLLQIGSGAVIGLAKPIFISLSKYAGGSSIIPLDTYLGQVSAESFLDSVGNGYASWLSYALIIGLAINIILIALKKWTNVHSLMITGHVMFQQAAATVPIVLVLMFSTGYGMTDSTGALTIGAQIGTIVFSGVLLGTYWGVASTSTIKGADVVTQGAGFAVGHQQMWGAAIAYKIGKYFGKADDSSENRKMPKGLKVFEDNIFTQSMLILLVFIVLILIIQFAPGYDSLRFGDSNGFVNGALYGAWKVGGGSVYWPINLILGSFQIVAAIIALQTGVRMFVSELQQAFQGISEKLIPGAVVAVDVAATYGFSPNSVTFGFVAGTIAQFIGVGLVIGLSIGLTKLQSSFHIPIVIPLFITLFFNSGSIGVFANASGGFRATIIIPVIFGFLEIVVIALGLGMVNSFGMNEFHKTVMLHGDVKHKDYFDTFPYLNGYNGMFDWTFVWGLVMVIGGGHPYAAYIVLPLYIVGMLFLAQLIDSARQYKPTGLQKLLKIKPKLLEQKEEQAEPVVQNA